MHVLGRATHVPRTESVEAGQNLISDVQFPQRLRNRDTLLFFVFLIFLIEPSCLPHAPQVLLAATKPLRQAPDAGRHAPILRRPHPFLLDPIEQHIDIDPITGLLLGLFVKLVDQFIQRMSIFRHTVILHDGRVTLLVDGGRVACGNHQERTDHHEHQNRRSASR